MYFTPLNSTLKNVKWQLLCYAYFTIKKKKISRNSPKSIRLGKEVIHLHYLRKVTGGSGKSQAGEVMRGQELGRLEGNSKKKKNKTQNKKCSWGSGRRKEREGGSVLTFKQVGTPPHPSICVRAGFTPVVYLHRLQGLPGPSVPPTRRGLAVWSNQDSAGIPSR